METSLGLDCSPLSCNLMAREFHVNGAGGVGVLDRTDLPYVDAGR
jgi:hypothetical protein